MGSKPFLTQSPWIDTLLRMTTLSEIGSSVYVCGHKNPDSDSVCAAWAYARLKNRLGSKHPVLAIRCGHLTRQTEAVFQMAGVEPPPFLKNLHRSLGDVMNRDTDAVDASAPLEEVLHTLDLNHRHAAPVVDSEGAYRGVINLNILAGRFLGIGKGRTELLFRSGNVARVLQTDPVSRGRVDGCALSMLIGAFPFEGFSERLAKLVPAHLLLVTGERDDVLRYAMAAGVAAVVVTGVSDPARLSTVAKGYAGWLFVSPYDTLETYRRLLLSTPVAAVMSSDARTLPPSATLHEAAEVFHDHNQRGIPVLDDGRLVGIVTRTDLIEPPARKLILVDHNELAQAIEGADEADILEVIDHHRMGSLSSTHPMTVYARPVGSTCTLVYERYLAHDVVPARDEALVLLSGIIADTLALRSPTATAADKLALAALAAVAGLADWRPYADELFARSGSLKTESAAQVVARDCKIYEEHGLRMAISQVEVLDMDEVQDAQEALLDAVRGLRAERGLDWAMLLVTDIIHGRSLLLSDGLKNAAGLFKYTSLTPSVHDLPGVLSRKKQLLPEVLRVAALCGQKAARASGQRS